jgi:hypothetical protein
LYRSRRSAAKSFSSSFMAAFIQRKRMVSYWIHKG